MNEKETKKFRYIVSKITDPHLNQALDESLLNSVYQKKSDFILRFWKSDPCVIIGRNQSINAEVNTEYCRKNQIPIIRRISGGGAVYLDLGCLNFSFLFNSTCKFFTKNIPILNKFIINMIIEALNTLSFKCEFQPPNSIFLDGKKISGNAQIYKGNSVLHHGTLLYRTDLKSLEYSLNSLSQVINQNKKQVKSNKVKSTNLYFFNTKQTEADIIDCGKKIIQKTLDFNLKTDEITKEEFEYAKMLKFKRYCSFSWQNRFI